MLSGRVVTALPLLFSLVMMLPGKHYLVETEDPADENNGMSLKSRDSRDYWGGPRSYAQQLKHFGIQRYGRYYGSRRPFAFFPTTTTTQRTTTTSTTTTTTTKAATTTTTTTTRKTTTITTTATTKSTATTSGANIILRSKKKKGTKNWRDSLVETTTEEYYSLDDLFDDKFNYPDDYNYTITNYKYEN